MRILHTADWHLGKIVNQVHMTHDQQAILDHALDVIKEYEPDAVVVAGDLYDRSVPPKEAVELLNHILTRLIKDRDVPVLAISGNHDSPDRLEFGNQLFKSQGLYLETKVESVLRPVTLHDQYGPVHFHLIPYIEPAEVASMFGDETIRSHQQAMERLVEYIHAHSDMNERHVWVGHAFLAGGMESESEERLSMIGGSSYVDARIFKHFTYVAMGHLHQPQKVWYDHIRYSGSLLKYSFSEATHNKSVSIIDLDEHGLHEMTHVPLKPERDLEIVEGYFADLLEGEAAEQPNNYLHVRLLDEGQLVDPMAKLRNVYPNILRLERKSSASDKQLYDLQRIKEKQRMSHTEVFASFYEDMMAEPLSEKRKQMMEQVIEKVERQERGQ
ncbi:exonuclease SbcCD subunit D [Thalassobacillus sp. CUG 92003]|uniref:exonuclease SbcCD subunit D n=1 Tax=Thalassobacillus sp. CUG 92003 TaxID=2736641 RepID=UPI0015E7AA33|nr:exonuclease SbcCD subunit D [Thalassobacillus sp. CUG 92003]